MENKRISEKVVMASEHFLKEENYWLEQLKGDLVKSHFLYDGKKEKGEKKVFPGKSAFNIEGETSTGLTRISSGSDPMLFVILAAGLVVLLYKYTGNLDIIVGTTIDKQEADGEFINTILPLRNRLKPHMTFRELLLQVRETIVKAIENQNYPVSALISRLNMSDIEGYDEEEFPLFAVAILLENIQDKRYLKPLNLDMVFSITRRAEGLKGMVQYNSLRYEETTVERIITHYRHLLDCVVSHSDRQLDDLDLLSVEEKRKILNIFNDTGTSYPKEKTIQRLFAEQVEKTPDQIALIGIKNSPFGIRSTKPIQMPRIQNSQQRLEHLTYQELNQRSQRLARLLRSGGVGPGTITGIMIRRCIEMIYGILAILKAGSAYLPIDTDYPGKRIRQVLKDSHPRTLLIAGEYSLPLEDDLRVIDIQGKESGAGDEDAAHLPYEGKATDLAYVIYTSGTTGIPRGTLVEHRSVVRLVKQTNFIKFYSRDRLLQTGALEFDASTFEIWGPLLNGSSLVLVAKEAILHLEVLKKIVKNQHISIMWLTSSMFNQVSDIEIFSGLKHLLVGGDVLSPPHISRVKEAYKHLNIINGYGPTENTTFSTTYLINGQPGEIPKRIPIGKPIANSTTYIVDKNYDFVPIGVMGELVVGGDGVARGYLNHPELTAERFCLRHPEGRRFAHGAWRSAPTPRKNFLLKGSDKYRMQSCIHASMHPCNQATRQLSPHHSPHSLIPPFPHSPIYQTGDLVRWLEDGNIEFFGRMDLQLKIRGYRVEPGEIEGQLLKYPGINEALVLANQDEVGEKYLCAYIAADVELNVSQLRESLSRQLPAYMVPSYFIPLQRLPLTTNGKVDRNELPLPRVRPGQDYEAPHNEVERKLAKIWSEVLGIKKIGINDNFFEIGGDSIKSIQISARSRKYGITVEITDIFLYPTIKELAGCVKTIGRVIPQGPVRGKVPLTPIQQWFFQKTFTDSHHFNHAVMFYREIGFEEKTIKKVFQKIVRHHDALRMVYEVGGDRVLQVNKGMKGKFFHLEILHLKEDGSNDIKSKVEKTANRIQAGMNLSSGPLVRLCLLKAELGDHLLIAAHHLIIDGVSWRILLEDFSTGYEQALKGEEITFPAKTDSFKYWSQKLSRYAGSEAALKELPYWQKIEESAPGKLPRDYEVEKEKLKRKYTESITMKLTAAETLKLLKEANRAYNTEINDILLTALAKAVKDWRGINNLLIIQEGHGREPIMEDVVITRTIGWYTSAFPVLLDISRAKDLTDEIKTIKELLRKIPNRGIGYGILRYLTPAKKKKGINFSLQPEVSFNYLGQFGQAGGTTRRGLQLSGLPKGNSISPEMERFYTLEFSAITLGENFSFTFNYNRNEYRRSSIRDLAGCYKKALTEIVHHCLNKKEKEFTPSDFTKKDMDMEELNDVLDMVGDISIDA